MDDLISSTRGVRQVRRARKGLTKSARARFFDALAATCNITKAAAFAGVHPTTVYRKRETDPVFADQWVAAMAIGYDRIEALVLEYGGAGEDIEIDPDQAVKAGLEVEPFDFDRAMKILNHKRAAREEARSRPTRRPARNATREETNAALIKALNAARRRMEAYRARSE